MIYYQCQCGVTQMWDSYGGAPPCRSCDDCGMTLEAHAAAHKKPVPHDLQGRWITTDGKPAYIMQCTRRMCRYVEEVPKTLWPKGA